MECDNMSVVDGDAVDRKADDGHARDGAAASTTNSSQHSQHNFPSSPKMKTRSLSDGGSSTPGRSGRASPSPFLLSGSAGSGVGPARSGSKDDSSLVGAMLDPAPVTPRRPSPFALALQQARGLSAIQTTSEPMQLSQTPQKDQQHQPPSTPVSASSAFSLQQHHQQHQHLYNSSYISKPTPLSPKLDPSQIYASPTNILPRRSRGLDFSRSATSLHHSTLAEQSSPGSSPLHLNGSNGGNSSGSGATGAMAIPGRKSGDYGGATESSTSLWSMMGRSQESNSGKAAAAANGGGTASGYYPSSSMGSVNTNPHLGGTACSDSSSSDDDDDLMDEDTEEPFVTTPQVGKTINTGMRSPAMNSLLSFTHRQRPRKQGKRLVKGPLGLGFSSISATSMGGGTSSPAAGAAGVGAFSSNYSKSPPMGSGFLLGRDAQQGQSRRESISWAANQLHISGSESDDTARMQMDVGDALGQRGVIRRQVSRRGNLLPKTKGFARIRAALAEESAPGDADFRRESEVVRQVLESDMDPVELHNHQHRLPPPANTSTLLNRGPAAGGKQGADAAAAAAMASPRLLDNLDDIPDDDMAMDAFGKPRAGAAAGGNRLFWNKPSNAQPSTGSLARLRATTPPPPQSQPGTSYALMGMADDTNMDSPGGSSSNGTVFPSGAIFPMTTSNSSRGGTPQLGGGSSGNGAHAQATSQNTSGQGIQGVNQGINGQGSGANSQVPGQLPSAAEITRRINSKRRRDDDSDLDPMSFKRRAVSPSISVHDSPIMQSPLQLQRDVLSWSSGATCGSGVAVSRPGSVSGGIGSIGLFELAAGSGGGSSSVGGSSVGTGAGAGAGAGAGTSGGSSTGRTNKGRVGYQAMVDANDSITRLSID